MRLEAEQVKEAVDIAKVIGEYVPLKRAGSADELVGICPFHQERTPSFTVTISKQSWYCFGCGIGGDVFSFVQRIEGGGFGAAVKRVAETSGIDESTQGAPIAPSGGNARRGPSQEPRVVATYPYVDERGELLYEVQRVEPGRHGKKKDFWQRRRHPLDGDWVIALSEGRYRKDRGVWRPVKDPDDELPGDDELPAARRVLYRLPAVLASDEVWLVEGEKDVHTLEAGGLVATTNSGGSKQPWTESFSESLRGKRVVILPDNDKPGKEHAAEISRALVGVAAEVLVVELPVEAKGDVTDYVQAGHTVADVVALVEAKRRDLVAEELERRGLLTPIEIVGQFDGGVSAFLDPSRRPPGLQTGFVDFDQMTLGLQPGELVILAARPAMGKTALALNIATNVASKGTPVAIFSLEMSRESLLTRMVCARAGVDSLRFRAGQCGRDEQLRLSRAFAGICEMPLRIDDAPAATIKSVHRKAALMQQQCGLGLVIVDYLGLMDGGEKENRNQEVSALSRGMKLIARDLKVPMIVLSQLSRAVESRQDHRPVLSDLRDSGGIEQDADIVTFIYREEVYHRDRPDLRGLAELIVAKQRNGPIGIVNLVYLHAQTKFENRAYEGGL